MSGLAYGNQSSRVIWYDEEHAFSRRGNAPCHRDPTGLNLIKFSLIAAEVWGRGQQVKHILRGRGLCSDQARREEARDKCRYQARLVGPKSLTGKCVNRRG